MNVLDEVPQSYSHQGNPKLDQTRYIAETRDHGSMYLEVARLLSIVYAFCEKEKHAIMDCLFAPFHIKANMIKYVELQDVARALMDQLQN